MSKVDQLRPRLWADLEPSDLARVLADPPDRYRPVPWLAWTGELQRPRLEGQLRDMLEKGITEFFLFPLYGMELPYMSAAYWERVAQTLEFCRLSGMKCWIYDEYDWPSGVCAGQVLRDHPEHREKLLWLRTETSNEPGESLPPGVEEVHESGGAHWAIAPKTRVYVNVKGCDWVSEVPGYLDVLSPQACRGFIQYTHDRYHGQFPDMFAHGQSGREVIPGFFTDEPALHPRTYGAWIGLPCTGDLFVDFSARYGYDLGQRLADLIIDRPGAARTRCHYWRWIAERFGEAYAGQQRAWCDRHGVALTGHLLDEDTLPGLVAANGDLWEVLKHFTIPGIDILANADGFTYPDRVDIYGGMDRRGFHLTCKLAHGAVRHTGGREMMSEAYGTCDWGMNLFRQKRGFHYQVAMGATLINENSLMTSIADFRKYALSGKHFTQPWWAHYRQYADYNARLAALHAEGEAVADVAVLFPRSTMWALTEPRIWHPVPGEPQPLAALQELVYDLLDELIRRQWSFDFVFEPVLEASRAEGDRLVTEHARYRALIVPSATHLPRGCMEVVQAFAKAGGILIFAGDLPASDPYAEADLKAEVAEALSCERTLHVAASGAAACEALAGRVHRPLVLAGEVGRDFVCSWRRLAGSDVFFLANMAERPVDVSVELNAGGPPAVLDPDTLECYRPATGSDGRGFDWHFEPWQGFLVLTGDAAAPENLAPQPAPPSAPAWLNPARVETLDGDWEFAVEPGNMLRLSPQVRPDPDNCGAAEGWHRDRGQEGWITPREGRLAEPILPGESPWYWLRARVVCEPGSGPGHLVADNPDFLEVYVNGRPARQVAGDPVWTEENVWFDVAELFAAGENYVHVRARTSKYNDPRIAPLPEISGILQPVVLLGEFLVQGPGQLAPWRGRAATDAPWEEQGLPHFAGVGVYRRTIDVRAGARMALHLPVCADSVEVRVNDEFCGVRAWAPYLFHLSEDLCQGENELEVRVHNTLGNIITETFGGCVPVQRPTSGLGAAPRLLHLTP